MTPSQTLVVLRQMLPSQAKSPGHGGTAVEPVPGTSPGRVTCGHHPRASHQGRHRCGHGQDLPQPLTTEVVALVGTITAVSDAIAEVPVRDAALAAGAGEGASSAAASTAQLVAAVAAVSFAIAEPAPRHTLPAAAAPCRRAAAGCWVTPGVTTGDPRGHTQPCLGTARGSLTGGRGQCRSAASRALIPAITAVADTVAHRGLADAGTVGARELPRGAGHHICGGRHGVTRGDTGMPVTLGWVNLTTMSSYRGKRPRRCRWRSRGGHHRWRWEVGTGHRGTGGGQGGRRSHAHR